MKNLNHEHFNLLGCKVKDKVTTIEGIATSISFFLVGCVQVTVTPLKEKGEKQEPSKFFDLPRIEVLNNVPVMNAPQFPKGYEGADFEIFACKAKHKVSGFEGIITGMSFDLYGCIQVSVSPQVDETGKRSDGFWFDLNSIEILDKTPVMKVPDFLTGFVSEGKKGADPKPAGLI